MEGRTSRRVSKWQKTRPCLGLWVFVWETMYMIEHSVPGGPEILEEAEGRAMLHINCH